MIVTRRAALALLLDGCAVTWAECVAGTGTARPRSTLQRWRTGNRTLAPLSRAGPLLLFAGERTLGAISLDRPQPLWTLEHGLAQGAVFRPRATGHRVVCAGRDAIVCGDLDGGQWHWRHVARMQTGAPLVQADRTYVGDGHEILALDTATGAPLWRFPGIVGTLASYAPAIAGDTVLAGPGDGRLYALAAGDGRLRWVIDRSAEWQYLRQLHVSGHVLVAGSYREKLYGISVDDGTVLWSFDAGNFINSHHIAGDTTYLWSPTGWIFAIDVASGALRWRHRTTDYTGAAGHWAPVMAELVTEQGKLYALAMDDVLHVLDRLTGKEVERLRLPERARPSVLPIPAFGLAFATALGEVLLIAR
ncbi:MAG: PQQ-binding-like beta-propeller repeat protein [Burkholderiaceae bacterium]|nr:PQQ-binding-like beta-propeller repeat protein [Burkholderiaceae bacterium]